MTTKLNEFFRNSYLRLTVLFRTIPAKIVTKTKEGIKK
jgi:hypothetical protein